jgi:hypothetical protein
MLITTLINGRPVQTYQPNPVVPKLLFEAIADFKKLESEFLKKRESQKFDASLALKLIRAKVTTDLNTQIANMELAVAEFSQEKSKLSPKLIEHANRLVSGNTSAAIRKGIGWVQSDHPADSWHVGAHPKHIPKILEALRKIEDQPWPTLLKALVLMMVLLQAHPFSDGNGRTARLLGTWLCHRDKPELAVSFANLLDVLWSKQAYSLHYASHLIKVDNNWDELIQLVTRSS